jgi:hypothetical protein
VAVLTAISALVPLSALGVVLTAWMAFFVLRWALTTFQFIRTGGA